LGSEGGGAELPAGAEGPAAPVGGAVVAVVPPGEQELPPGAPGHGGFFLPCFFFVVLEQLDAVPVVVVVVDGFFLVGLAVVDVVPGDAAGAAAATKSVWRAGWATWPAASAELSPARPAAAATAPAAASRPMRMRDIGTSLFRRGGRHHGPEVSGAPAAPGRATGAVPNFSAERGLPAQRGRNFLKKPEKAAP
jgi:hypothetical protein